MSQHDSLFFVASTDAITTIELEILKLHSLWAPKTGRQLLERLAFFLYPQTLELMLSKLCCNSQLPATKTALLAKWIKAGRWLH